MKPLENIGLAHHRPGRVVGALLVAIAVTAPSASPTEASQGPEVFARGYGSKAAAMGNSFVSIADDASAVFWNPAGAGWIPRKTITFSLTDLYFSDVEYSSVSYVHPINRIGALGFSLTRWSVEGIEKRDDNNLLIRDDLTDRQLEFIASYSSPPIHNLTAALGVKMDTQMMDDESALGMGLDLALLYRCLAPRTIGRGRLSAGVNLRNVISPVLEMKSDRTSFPTKAVFSASYSGGRTAYLDNWTLALDINGSSGLPGSANFGIEAALHPVFLRLGSQDGRMTAGLGTIWEGLSFDYAYTAEDYGRLHTFSLSLAFGSPSPALAGHDEESPKLAAQ